MFAALVVLVGFVAFVAAVVVVALAVPADFYSFVLYHQQESFRLAVALVVFAVAAGLSLCQNHQK